MYSIIHSSYFLILLLSVFILSLKNQNAHAFTHASFQQPFSLHKISATRPLIRPQSIKIVKNISSKSVLLFAETTSDSKSGINPPQDDNDKKGLVSKIVNIFRPKSTDNLSTKEMLAKMGLSALLSYGFVSNMSYCVTVSLAWFGFTKKTGMSPLAPGQWKGFLAIYAGFYVFNNIVRPLRVAISLGVSKYFDAAITTVQNKLRVSKPVAIGVVVFLANIVGTCSLMSLGILLASTLSGVPIFPPKL